MFPLVLLVITFSWAPCTQGLQCYTGFKYLAGQSVGTDVETCSLPTDYCYNASAGFTQFAQVTMAGCSTTLCFVSQNKCITQNFQGHDLYFCCCNGGDLCNSKYTNLSTVGQVQQRFSDWMGILG